MKGFRTISTIFITVIALVFAGNIFYLVNLYKSIRSNLEREVMTAMADADIDDMWERADLANRTSIAEGMAADDAAENVPSESLGSVSGVKDPDGNFVTTATDIDGKTTVVKKPLRRDRSYTNQMVNDMSQQMHANMDPYVDFNLAIMDSIMFERLADRRIYPDFIAVDVVNSNGDVLHGNPHTPGNAANFDVFTLCFNPDSDMHYRAYMTPLTRHIFSEISGIITTVFLLILSFALAFIYLFHTVSRLRSIEEMKDDFVNNMTHELKTPIAIAYSANDALMNYGADNDPEKRTTYLKIANRQLKRLSELVESILAMSMERRKTMQLKPEIVELRPLIEETAAIHRLRTDKKIEILTDFDGYPSVRADKTHLVNILGNLIDNAIKYSGHKVRITIACTDGSISITDDGIGIPPKAQQRIFDKFYRVPQGNLSEVSGYGIGLYYVKSIVDKMGWRIDVSSHVGLGSKFTLFFSENE